MTSRPIPAMVVSPPEDDQVPDHEPDHVPDRVPDNLPDDLPDRGDLVINTDGPEPNISNHTDKRPPKDEDTKQKERPEGGFQNGRLAPEERPTLTRRRGALSPRNRQQSLEAKFVQSIRRRDVSGVEAIMEADPELRRLEDHYGVSALEHAVVSGSVEIVERLLANCSTSIEKQQAIERAMLFAIKENNLHMMDRLITLHQDLGVCKAYNRRLQEATGDVTTPEVDTMGINLEMHSSLRSSPSLDMFYEDAEFSQDIKPMVLAAQLDRAEIIEMLHDRCCPAIHPVTQACSYPKDCLICHHQVNVVGRQSIEECRQAIDVYKALSSPAYMFHSGAEDPILEAFVISDLMEKRQVVDPAYRDQYQSISLRCKTFASTLLSLCRSVEEVQTMFGASDGIELTHRTKFHQARFPRLLLAIHFNQKEFVAHPHCQQVMQFEWYKGLPDWVCQLRMHHFRLAMYTLLLFTFMPIIFILYLFRIKHIERFVKPAANKFILDMCSFIYFLIMLFCKVSLRLNPERGGTLSVLDCFIFIWVIGLTVRYTKMSLRRRDRCTFYWLNAENSNWRIFEMVTLVCFWLQYLLLFGLMIHVGRTGEGIKMRQELHGMDAYLWSEVFGAIACTLTVVQVYSFFKVSSTLGPLQVSLKKMIFDVLKFMVLFLVVLSAFAIGLASLYSGYKGLMAIDPETLERLVQDDAFTSLQQAYKRLFWDLFNYGNEENANLVAGNDGAFTMFNVSKGNVTDVFKTSHRLTEIIGYIMYGAYHITVIVVLLNMLIAMMANSYNNIEANADMEWKFARTRLFMNYFNEIGVLCPPFNLLPVRALLAFLAKKFACFKVFERKQSKANIQGAKALMGRIRKRYWKLQVAKKKSKTTAESDLTQTKRGSAGSTASSQSPGLVPQSGMDRITLEDNTSHMSISV